MIVKMWICNIRFKKVDGVNFFFYLKSETYNKYEYYNKTFIDLRCLKYKAKKSVHFF